MTSNKFAVWMLLAAFGAAGAACGDDESAATGTTSSSAAATGSGGDSSTTSTTTTASSMTTTTATGTGGAGTGGAGTGGAGTGGAGTGGAGTGGAGTGGAGTGGAGGTGTGGAGGAGTGGAGGAGSGGAGGGSGAQLVINEVVPDPVVDGDWVEFFNAGDEAADLTGWTMTDDDPTHVFEFPAGTIVEPGAYLTLEKDLPNSFTFGLGTSGDQVNVYDGDGVVVDSTGWSAGDADLPTSWGRLPNGTGDFQTLAVPTKGTENL